MKILKDWRRSLNRLWAVWGGAAIRGRAVGRAAIRRPPVEGVAWQKTGYRIPSSCGGSRLDVKLCDERGAPGKLHSVDARDGETTHLAGEIKRECGE